MRNIESVRHALLLNCLFISILNAQIPLDPAIPNGQVLYYSADSVIDRPLIGEKQTLSILSYCSDEKFLLVITSPDNTSYKEVIYSSYQNGDSDYFVDIASSTLNPSFRINSHPPKNHYTDYVMAYSPFLIQKIQTNRILEKIDSIESISSEKADWFVEISGSDGLYYKSSYILNKITKLLESFETSITDKSENESLIISFDLTGKLDGFPLYGDSKSSISDSGTGKLDRIVTCTVSDVKFLGKTDLDKLFKSETKGLIDFWESQDRDFQTKLATVKSNTLSSLNLILIIGCSFVLIAFIMFFFRKTN